ncbi:MAG: (4Fe-4S)-binding protein [Eubacteriales bacterium]|nr:(4Fe-4S)-binding protein [Eubacteriales bacterium]
MSLTQAQIMAVKGQGFLQNRGTELFSGRVVAPGTVFTAQNFADLSELANTFGNGKLICTSRLAVEVPGIPYEKIEEAKAFAAEHGLRFGGTGAKVRPIATCKGTTCIYGNYDTHELSRKIHEAYYIGWTDVKLPHKFKIAVGGCPNSCMKPSLNDFGIEGRKAPVFDSEKCRGCASCAVEKRCPMNAAHVVDGKLQICKETCIDCGVCTGKCPFGAVADTAPTRYQIYIGGTWGKRTRIGTPLSRLVEEEEILPILEKTMLWYKENGFAKERLGMMIDRLGIQALEAAIAGDDLLQRKDEILAAEIRTRP